MVCTIQSFRGNTIARMTRRLQAKGAKLEQFDHVIFHVGINDIGNKCTVKQILSDYGNLIGVCRNVKDSINIVISAILPRLVDHLTSDLTSQILIQIGSITSKIF